MLDLRLNDLAAAQATCAHPHALVALGGLSVHRAQVNVPAPLGDVVRVTDVVSRLRPSAANFTNLCHELLQKTPDARGETLIIPALSSFQQPGTTVGSGSV